MAHCLSTDNLQYVVVVMLWKR